MVLALAAAVPMAGLAATAVAFGAELSAFWQKNRRPPWRRPADGPITQTALWSSRHDYWTAQLLRLVVVGVAIELLYIAGQIDSVRTAVYAGFSASLIITRLAEGKDIGDIAAAAEQKQGASATSTPTVSELNVLSDDPTGGQA